ncbi:MAG: hypothetical protein IJU70_14410 [Lentisphaeria bacterium]|nr:hypothetical protein [Lentisphaeria bacterium]
MKKTLTTAVCALTVFCGALEFDGVFQSGMVLQQGRELAFRGTASPGEKVALTFAGKRVAGKADGNGRWRLVLPALPASKESRQMVLKGEGKTVTLDDVLVGEVWLCSGQSNMYWPLGRSLNGKETAGKSDFPEIRVFRTDGSYAPSPQTKTKAKWRKLTPKLADGLSAVAFYFGRKLHQELNVPVGLLCAYRGGTMIEPWTPEGAYDPYPELKKKIAERFSGEADPKSKSPKDWPQNRPHVLYNGSVHPLTPYTFRGVIWYQGCSNVWYDTKEEYLLKQQALFDGWKKAFANAEMKFYTVQIAPLNRGGAAARNHVGVWLAQQEFADRNTPAVKLAVINDVGDLKNIHPVNKEPVGLRLAALALKYDYGRNIPADFPRLRTAERRNGALHLAFDHVGKWKTADGKEIRNFEIAGADGKFFPARAESRGGALTVSAPEVPEPLAVRYMYNCSRIGNLVNEAGLPLGTFEKSVKK